MSQRPVCLTRSSAGIQSSDDQTTLPEVPLHSGNPVTPYPDELMRAAAGVVMNGGWPRGGGRGGRRGGRTAAGWSARGRGEEPGYCSVPTLSEWGRRHCRTTLHLHPQKPSSSADGSSLAPPFFRYCCMPFLSATAGRAAPGACPAVLTNLLPFNSLYYSIVYFYI